MGPARRVYLPYDIIERRQAMKRLAMLAATGLLAAAPSFASARPFWGFGFFAPVPVVVAPAPVVIAPPPVPVVVAPAPVVVPAPRRLWLWHPRLWLAITPPRRSITTAITARTTTGMAGITAGRRIGAATGGKSLYDPLPMFSGAGASDDVCPRLLFAPVVCRSSIPVRWRTM